MTQVAFLLHRCRRIELLIKIYFIYANLLLENLARRYTFAVYLFFIGSFIHETLANNVYLDILRGIEVENFREK